MIGCRNESQQPAAGTETSTATQTTASAPSTSSWDLQFLDTMSRHHEQAIQMAKAAQGKVQLAELKEMTKRIPEEQQKEIDQMKAWREQWYPGAAPAENMQMPGMGSSMNMDMSHLDSMNRGKAYDSMFIDMMIPHHQGAVQMAQDALGKAEHQEVKTLAQQIIDKQQKEIDEMKQWKSKLGS
jgi:uncharacterized protein (DUF305 family)